MHREPLLELLGRYKDDYPEEELTRRRVYQFVRRHHNCFDRELLRGHITGSAWVLDREHRRTLLTHHRKLNRWLQPGGHADGDNDVARVALREAVEETGLKALQIDREQILDLDVHMIPARGAEPEHYHYDCRFLVTCTGDDTFVVSDESHDLAWVGLDALADYTDEESVLRMARKILSRRAA